MRKYQSFGCSREDPHSPTKEISAIQRGLIRGEQFVSDYCKCIRVLLGPLN
jgi:hypothetical protein